MEQNRLEEFVESLPVARHGVGSSLSMQESGLEESVRKEENMKVEFTGKRQSTCFNVLSINVRFVWCLHQSRLDWCDTLLVIQLRILS